MRLGKVSSGTDGEFDMERTLVKHEFGDGREAETGGGCVGWARTGLGLTGGGEADR
jgi:hypothetical protein